MSKSTVQLERLLARVSNEYYRLSDYTFEEKFSPELIESINQLGLAIDVVSSMIEAEKMENSNQKVLAYNL